MQDLTIVIPANPAIFSFGFDKIVKILTLFCQTYPQQPLVSVGCGIAVLERVAKRRVENEFFLIDPAPNSFYPYCKDIHQLIVQAGMPATHSFTKELLETNPSLAKGERCILFLNWCDYGINDYDLEAIRLLKPHAILAIVDMTGSAGSEQFHAFLKSTKEYKIERHYTISDPGKEKHLCSHTSIVILWLYVVSTDNKPYKLYMEESVCLQSHGDDNIQNRQVLSSRAREQKIKELTHSFIEDLSLLCHKS